MQSYYPDFGTYYEGMDSTDKSPQPDEAEAEGVLGDPGVQPLVESALTRVVVVVSIKDRRLRDDQGWHDDYEYGSSWDEWSDGQSWRDDQGRIVDVSHGVRTGAGAETVPRETRKLPGTPARSTRIGAGAAIVAVRDGQAELHTIYGEPLLQGGPMVRDMVDPGVIGRSPCSRSQNSRRPAP